MPKFWSSSWSTTGFRGHYSQTRRWLLWPSNTELRWPPLTTTSAVFRISAGSIRWLVAKYLSQTRGEQRYRGVDASHEAVAEIGSNVGRLDIETIFHAQYGRIARVIARVLRDPARAEELAVEVFLKWSRNPQAQGENAQAWLYRVAVRTGLDELRRQTRRAQRERLLRFVGYAPTPE